MGKVDFDPAALDEVDIENGGVDERGMTGRDRVDKNGFYHLYILSINPQNDDSGSITGVRLGLQVLAGTEGDQVGGKFDHFVNFRKKDGSEISDVLKRQNARFVRALSLASDEAILSGKYRAKWSQSEGRQFFGKVVVKPDNSGSDRAQIDFGQVWRPGDEAAKKIPAHIESLQLAGYPIEGQASFVASQEPGASTTPGDSDNIPF